MTDWEFWRGHADAAVATRGVWVGLLNEKWEPICDIPVVSMDENATRMAAGDISLDVAVGEYSQVVEELVGEGLGEPNVDGTFTPSNVAARWVGIQTTAGRYAYFIPSTIARVTDRVVGLKIEGVGMLQLLEDLPCPSVPVAWRGGWREWREDAGAKYASPRVLTAVELAEVADGYTVKGDAVEVVRRVIDDSITAALALVGARERHMVVDWSPARAGREVLVRPDDGDVWGVVAEPARAAGVTISARLWWPGDEAVPQRTGPAVSPIYPMCVFDVTPIEEA